MSMCLTILILKCDFSVHTPQPISAGVLAHHLQRHTAYNAVEANQGPESKQFLILANFCLPAFLGGNEG